MAESKLVQVNERIAAGVTAGFQKVNDAVVGKYTEIEDWFVDRYLKRDGESVAEAKTRLRQEQKAREQEQELRKQEREMQK